MHRSSRLHCFSMPATKYSMQIMTNFCFAPLSDNRLRRPDVGLWVAQTKRDLQPNDAVQRLASVFIHQLLQEVQETIGELCACDERAIECQKRCHYSVSAFVWVSVMPQKNRQTGKNSLCNILDTCKALQIGFVNLLAWALSGKVASKNFLYLSQSFFCVANPKSDMSSCFSLHDLRIKSVLWFREL